MTAAVRDDCALCHPDGELIVWANASWRVIRVDDPDFPAYYRLIAAKHVSEFSDLATHEQFGCTALLAALEVTIRTTVTPTSMNLAALGNRVPHLHWHAVARFEWDSKFPGSIWEPPIRSRNLSSLAMLRSQLSELDGSLRIALTDVSPHS